MMPPPRPRAARMATAMATTAHTADSMPREMPDEHHRGRAGAADSAMSRTGLN